MGKKILYITSSPRKDSHSTRTADIFVEAYQQAHPDDTVERLDLWTANLPAFDGTKVIGKYAAAFGKELPEGSEERSSWDEVVKIIAHFKSFDAYVLAVPMWNFGVNYLFKQYIDIIVQPSLTFSYGPSGPAGLVTGKPVVVVTAKGGVYPDKSPIDFHVRVHAHAPPHTHTHAHAPPHTHTMLTRVNRRRTWTSSSSSSASPRSLTSTWRASPTPPRPRPSRRPPPPLPAPSPPPGEPPCK
jgi:FMN-dependent NADH-azoreductase